MPGNPLPAAERADPSLSAYVADFIVTTTARDIPADVAHLGKRSVLDGLGLALAGAASEGARITRRYLASLGISADRGCTVIASPMRLPARVPPLAHRLSIPPTDHADPQLRVTKDRGHGFTASPIALEADRGFFRAAGGGYSAEAIEGKLGRPWTFAFPGVSIKPHPSGSLTHPGMSVMLDLIRRHDLRPDRVKRVAVGTNHNMPNALIHHRPRTELQAKFSMEFCMAILLLERQAGLGQFTDDVVNRPDVQALVQKVDFGVHPDAEAAGFDKMTTIIEVELDDGTVVKGSADFGKGSPSNPMSDAELADKFGQCAAWGGLDRTQTQNLLDLAWRIETIED